MRFKVIDKSPVLIGSTIHKKKIGQVLEARTLKSKKESSYTRTTFTTKRENMTNLGGDKKGTLIFKNEKDKS